jgi:hypothetical protein
MNGILDFITTVVVAAGGGGAVAVWLCKLFGEKWLIARSALDGRGGDPRPPLTAATAARRRAWYVARVGPMGFSRCFDAARA